MPAVAAVLVTDFSSVFCWLAENALRRLRDEGRIELGYHALELFPAPVELGAPEPVDRAWPLAAELGLAPRTPSAPVRTRKAHELARIARAHGREDAVREALFAAYFAEDRDIGRIDVLVEVARDAGLDLTEAKVVLDIDTHAAAVATESARARQAGIGVAPVLLLGNGTERMRVDGAFSLAEWRALIDEAERTNQSEGRDV
jgi:predicted DsbA family dithiol-disulfide isomerase